MSVHWQSCDGGRLTCLDRVISLLLFRLCTAIWHFNGREKSSLFGLCTRPVSRASQKQRNRVEGCGASCSVSRLSQVTFFFFWLSACLACLPFGSCSGFFPAVLQLEAV